MDQEQENRLSRLFAAYRGAFPDIDPGPDFLARVWAKIDSARPVSWVWPLRQWATRLAAVAALASAALVGSLLLPYQSSGDTELLDASYVDVLAVNSLDEHESALWILAENEE